MSWLYNLGVLVVVCLADRVSDNAVCYLAEWDVAVLLHVIGRSFFHMLFQFAVKDSAESHRTDVCALQELVDIAVVLADQTQHQMLHADFTSQGACSFFAASVQYVLYM